jgi:hypothetical protein
METRPIGSVVPVVADRLPAVVAQAIILPAKGSPSAVSVAVSVADSPGAKLRSKGEIVSEVGTPSKVVTAPDALAWLASYPASPAKDAVRVTGAKFVSDGAGAV